MMFKVFFENVGRGKASWEENLKLRPDEVDLARMVKKHREDGRPILASQGVECWFDDGSTTAGYVTAGIRPVGRFRIEAEGLSPPSE